MAAPMKLKIQGKLNIRAPMPIPRPSTSAASLSGGGQLYTERHERRKATDMTVRNAAPFGSHAYAQNAFWR